MKSSRLNKSASLTVWHDICKILTRSQDLQNPNISVIPVILSSPLTPTPESLRSKSLKHLNADVMLGMIDIVWNLKVIIVDCQHDQE